LLRLRINYQITQLSNPMARIYLDARAVFGPSGLNRYCEGLIPQLAAQAPFHELIVIRLERAPGPPYTGAANVREVRVSGVTGTLPLLLSRRSLARVFAEHGPPDLLHALFHVVPFGIRAVRPAPTRVVVTLHDLIWVDYPRQVEPTLLHAWWRRRLGSAAIRYALAIADHVLCNSETTRRSAERWVDRQRTSVAYHGVAEPFFAPPPSEPPIATPPIIAAFGVAKPYKNVACLVRAFATIAAARPDVQLLLIGGDGGARDLIGRLGVADRVRITRSVGDTELRTLVRGASVFVVPSLVEGFGMPVLEAMALGTPVVISDTPALREVAGAAALAFDARQPASLAAALTKMLDGEGLSSRMSAAGRERARQFDWAKTAEQTLAVYGRLLRSGGGGSAVSVSTLAM
jgi:glycosyltransferase involved in cell wall biosynthesis